MKIQNHQFHHPKTAAAVLALCLSSAVCSLFSGTLLSVEASGNASTYGQAAGDEVEEPGVYDLILFWGQSNMVGCANSRINPFDDTSESLEEVSLETGIDLDILENTTSSMSSAVEVPENIAYDYQYIVDRLEPVTDSYRQGYHVIDGNGECVGITYDEESGTFAPLYAKGTQLTDIPSASVSQSVNMLSAFCAEYYEETGHGVLAVTVAVSGAPIGKFLPEDDPDYRTDVSYGDHIWECIMASYTGAMEKAREEEIPLAGAYFVMYQGEGDMYNVQYTDTAKKVITNLEMTGFKKGVMVMSSYNIGEAGIAEGVRKMHEWQTEIVAEDPNLAIGSSLDFDHYIPDEATYEGEDAYWRNKWGNLTYEEAFRRACLLRDANPYNMVHLNSAALSMIGRQCADSLADLISAGE